MLRLYSTDVIKFYNADELTCKMNNLVWSMANVNLYSALSLKTSNVLYTLV